MNDIEENEDFGQHFKNVEDYILYCYWDNSWINCFCDHCGVMFYLDTTPSIYRVKDKEPVNLFLCENCYFEIHKQHKKRGHKWEGYESWRRIIEDPELQ